MKSASDFYSLCNKGENQIVLSAGVTSDKMQQVGDSRIIKGTILDATGMPVIGANGW